MKERTSDEKRRDKGKMIPRPGEGPRAGMKREAKEGRDQMKDYFHDYGIDKWKREE